MDKIDWKRKLTSRKFWLAVISFVTSLLYAFNFSNITIEKIMPESEAIEEESGK